MTTHATGDAAAAKPILEKAGYTWTAMASSRWAARKSTVTLIDPSAYTDYAQDDALAAQQLRAAGIERHVRRPDGQRLERRRRRR